MAKTITKGKSMPYSEIIKNTGGNPKSASREKPAKSKGAKTGTGGSMKTSGGRKRGYGGKGM